MRRLPSLPAISHRFSREGAVRSRIACQSAIRRSSALPLGIASLGLLLCAQSQAQQKLIRLTSFPTIALADAKTQVTINAEIRDSAGRLVPDGTQVVFTTTLGNFREPIVKTSGGLARGTLTASTIPGVAKITATVMGGSSAPSTLEFEFVGDRKLLNSAQESIDVFAPESLEFTYDSHLLAASGNDDRHAKLSYRDISIDAEDLQYSLSSGDVRARKAHIRIGKVQHDFEQLYFNVNKRRGFGLTKIKTRRFETIVPNGRFGWAFVREKLDGSGYEIPPEEERLGILAISPGGVEPGTNTLGSEAFAFQDLSESISSVTAKRASIFPNKMVNFQRADLRVAGQRVMSVPLYQLSLTSGQTPIITEQIVNVNDNQLALNYPYYLSLGSNSSSLLRFRTGQSYGRAQGVNTGAYLDYELSWNKGDAQQGGLTFSGIARNDWSLGARHYMRLDDRSTATGMVEMPAGRSLFASGNYSRQFDGYQTSFSTNTTRTLRGPKFQTTDATFVVEKDPIAVKGTPFSLYLGATAGTSMIANTVLEQQQTTAGLRLRAQSLPIRLAPTTSLTTSFTANQLAGNLAGQSTTFFATTNLSHSFGPGASMLATYDLAIDGYNDALLGRHRVSMQANYNRGAANLSLFATRSIDIARQSLYADGSYRFAPKWRLGYGYTLDQYLGSSYRDYRFFLGFQLGFREVGLVYSQQTKRFGVQLLSVPVGF